MLLSGWKLSCICVNCKVVCVLTSLIAQAQSFSALVSVGHMKLWPIRLQNLCDMSWIALVVLRPTYRCVQNFPCIANSILCITILNEYDLSLWLVRGFLAIACIASSPTIVVVLKEKHIIEAFADVSRG